MASRWPLVPAWTATALLLCCSRPAGPANAEETEEARRPAEAMFLGSKSVASRHQAGPVSDLPKLHFAEHSQGLAVGGTWREHPLFHDLNGDGSDDLVASNREEDGLNAWLAPPANEESWSLFIECLPRDLMYGGADAADA